MEYQSPNCDTFKCSGENLPNFSSYFPSNKSVFLQILHHCSVSWKITPLCIFCSNNIWFPQKEPIKVKFFQTFEYSGQNLSNSLRQFWNDKSIPLQILYPYSISWKITPLYFFSSNNIYFSQKEPIKMNIFETFKCTGQNSLNSSCQLSNDKSIPLQILHYSSLSWQITPLWILTSYFFNFGLKVPIKIPVLRISSALVKMCHIPHVIFQITSQLKVMLDKSVNNVLGEGMQFLDKCSPLNFNSLDFPQLVWSYPNSSFDFWNLESVLYKCCTIL